MASSALGSEAAATIEEAPRKKQIKKTKGRNKERGARSISFWDFCRGSFSYGGSGGPRYCACRSGGQEAPTKAEGRSGSPEPVRRSALTCRKCRLRNP